MAINLQPTPLSGALANQMMAIKNKNKKKQKFGGIAGGGGPQQYNNPAVMPSRDNIVGNLVSKKLNGIAGSLAKRYN